MFKQMHLNSVITHVQNDIIILNIKYYSECMYVCVYIFSTMAMFSLELNDS